MNITRPSKNFMTVLACLLIHAALAGADVGTMPFSVLTQLLRHPLTDLGLKRFLQDWQSAQRNL